MTFLDQLALAVAAGCAVVALLRGYDYIEGGDPYSLLAVVVQTFAATLLTLGVVA